MSSCDYIRALRPNAIGRCGVGMAKAFVSLLVGRYCAGLSTTPLNGSWVQFSGLDGAWQHANYKEGPALSPRLSSSIPPSKEGQLPRHTPSHPMLSCTSANISSSRQGRFRAIVVFFWLHFVWNSLFSNGNKFPPLTANSQPSKCHV